MPPFGRMPGRAAETVLTFNLGNARPVQLTHCADHRVCFDGFGTSVVSDSDLPEPAGLIETGTLHLGVETDVSTQLILVGGVGKVLFEHWLRGKVLWPVLGPERVGVDVIGAVHPAARIGVLQPGTADIGVLFDYHKVDARLLQPDGAQQTGHSGTDDQYLECRTGVFRYF